MTYREKNAWLNFVCMTVAYAIYFSVVATRPEGRMMDIVILFGGIAGLHALSVIIGMIVLTMKTPATERVADERDRAISRRGASIAYYVQMVGMILVGVAMPFTETPWKIVNTALLALVVANAVSYFIVLLSYRRGWHG